MSVPINLLLSLGEKKGIEERNETAGSIDTSDTLNWKTTPLLLCICAFVIGGTQAFGEPISCYHPLEIKMWYKYVSTYCFLEGSYSMGNTTLDDIAVMGSHSLSQMKKENSVKSYQWVAFFLTFQLICFLLPGQIWKWARVRQSLDLDTILTRSELVRESMLDSKEREDKMNDLVEYLYETLSPSSQSSLSDHLSLTLLFLGIKMYSLVNVIYQFIFLIHFIDQDSNIFLGYEIIKSHMSGALTSRFFPLQVLCSVNISKMGNEQEYTMLCYLSLNYFHDKMFALLWLWYILLISYSTVSLLSFSFSLLPIDLFIRLLFSPAFYELNKRDIRDFYNKMLFTDGIIVLKFISKHKGRRLANEVAERIFAKFEQAEAISAWIYPYSQNE